MKNIYYYTQNLKKEDKTNEFFNRRGWLRLWNTTFGWQLAIPSSHLGISFEINPDGDDTVLISFQMFIFALYVWVDNWNFGKLIGKLLNGDYNGRKIGFVCYDWTINMYFWTKPMEWSNSDWDCYLDLKDIFLGKSIYSDKVIEERDIEITMPEKTYKGTAEVKMCTWKRPRWFAKIIKRKLS